MVTKYRLKQERIAFMTPFHPEFVRMARKRGGEFRDIRIDGTTMKAWVFDASCEAAIQSLCESLFPPATALVERTLTWSIAADADYAVHSPTLDGYDLLRFSRDHWELAVWSLRDKPVRILEELATTIQTHGSRNNPCLRGSITLKVRCRPDAQAGGRGWHVEESV